MPEKLLLDACCAPDATVAIERLRGRFDVTLLFQGSNIHPRAEYELRLVEVRRLSLAERVPLIVDSYEPEAWFEAVKGLENEPEGGARCEVCFKLRLRRAAQLARELGFDAFSTTLTTSPHKDVELIDKLGREAAEEFGVRWHGEVYRKRDGFRRSVLLSRHLGMYRQSYCGCVFSIYRENPWVRAWLLRQKRLQLESEEEGFSTQWRPVKGLLWLKGESWLEHEGGRVRLVPLPYSAPIEVEGVLRGGRVGPVCLGEGNPPEVLFKAKPLGELPPEGSKVRVKISVAVISGFWGELRSERGFSVEPPPGLSVRFPRWVSL